MIDGPLGLSGTEETLQVEACEVTEKGNPGTQSPRKRSRIQTPLDQREEIFNPESSNRSAHRAEPPIDNPRKRQRGGTI